jgi:cytochrome c
MKAINIGFAFGSLFAASIALSAVHPWGNPRTGVQPDAQLLQGSNVPEDVRRVLEKKCGDCHSGNTHYPAYTRLAPVSWMIERDVHGGRSVLDLSRWQDYTADARVDLLTRIASESRSGEMPLKQYLLLHPDNRLTTQEQQQIYDWAKAERRRIRQQLSENSGKPALGSKMERP